MPRRKPLKPVPRIRSEAEERAFWEVHDTADYLDLSRAKVGIFPNLKPSTETISLRLPSHLLAELKTLANKRDVPYQSSLKVFLAERARCPGAYPDRRSHANQAAAVTRSHVGSGEEGRFSL